MCGDMIEYLLFVASIGRARFAVKIHAFQHK